MNKKEFKQYDKGLTTIVEKGLTAIVKKLSRLLVPTPLMFPGIISRNIGRISVKEKLYITGSGAELISEYGVKIAYFFDKHLGTKSVKIPSKQYSWLTSKFGITPQDIDDGLKTAQSLADMYD